MKSSKKRICLYSSVVTAVLVVSLITVFMQNSGVGPHAIVALAAGTPDALGNQIKQIYFNQNTTGSWTQVGVLSYTDFVLNYNLTIPANQHTIVKCDVILNISLASTPLEAMARTRVYLNISGVATNAVMIAQGTSGYGGNWLVTFQWPSIATPPSTTWIPATDAVYTISYQYQAYY